METLVVRIRLGKQQDMGFSSIVRRLERLGLSLSNPVTKLITTFDSREGQIRIEPAALEHALHQKEPGSVQMWFSDSEDVFVSWDGDELCCYLDGIEAPKRKAVVDALTDYVVNFNEVGSRYGWRLIIEFV
jgi:hypothetical protein